MRILFDASNLGATGPEVLFKNLLPELAMQAREDVILLLLPSLNHDDASAYPQNVHVHHVHRSGIRELSRMVDINYGLARLSKRLKADLYFTFGDIGPISLPIPQVIYLHQPYIVYTEPELDQALPFMERVKLRYQRRHFSRASGSSAAVVVQTSIMAARVTNLYRLPASRVSVIRPPLPAHVDHLRLQPGTRPWSPGDGPFNLLFLATYYVHKNHAVLPGVARELRRRNIAGKVRISLTLDGDRRKAETALLTALETERDLIKNLGRLTPADAGRALMDMDALFLPTLVETFGLIYLEALAAGKPILTSDRDFARYLCGDLAIYFDPHDPVSIVDAVENVMSHYADYQSRMKRQGGIQIASVAGTAQSNATQLLDLFRKVLAAS